MERQTILCIKTWGHSTSRMRLDASDIRELNLLKYYRLIRKWACKTYSLKDADLELLIYLDCKERFTRNDFIDGTYTYSMGS